MYKVVWRKKLDELISDINYLMQEGWKPLGGFYVQDKATYEIYYQPMMKE